MVIQGQTVAPKTECQEDDKQPQEFEGGKAAVSTSWKLTKQQQEFIDLFSADEHEKQ